jgi:mono/diheme cytochrome c family protein
MRLPSLVRAMLIVVAGVMTMQAQTTIKHVRPKFTEPTAGKDMFVSYCAACHGVDAKGGGPAAPALKATLSDLTLMSQKNDGKFPKVRVHAILRGDEELAAHGSAEMPVWGTVLKSFSEGDNVVTMRITAIANYLESLQVK